MGPYAGHYVPRWGVQCQRRGPELILTLIGILGRVVDGQRPMEGNSRVHYSLA